MNYFKIYAFGQECRLFFPKVCLFALKFVDIMICPCVFLKHDLMFHGLGWIGILGLESEMVLIFPHHGLVNSLFSLMIFLPESDFYLINFFYLKTLFFIILSGLTFPKLITPLLQVSAPCWTDGSLVSTTSSFSASSSIWVLSSLSAMSVCGGRQTVQFLCHCNGFFGIF